MEGLGEKHELGSILKMKMNCFIKLILQKEPMQELKIPPKFARLFSEELPHRVILKGPSGGKWNAKLRKDNAGLYIHDGWREFHMDNSLGNKEFLLFEYNGKRSFEVDIFDPTGLVRIDVPVTEGTETNLHNGKRPLGRPRKCPVVSQKTYLKSQDKQNLEEEMDLRAIITSSEPRKRKQKKKLGKLTRGFPVSRSRFRCCSIEKNASSSEVNVRLRAVEEKMFASKFPYFMTYMKMFSLEKAKMLYIPRAFAQAHCPLERADIVLRNLEGNTWHVVCVINKNRHFFSGGWPAFIQDNKLGTGDICVFELISSKEFRVTIFRSPKTLHE
ncbi:hypothetical protein ACJRO7_034776 [Eucalyptus globulus]|uniref:TF-B3 domain-containing protein n=1 Tax=Eucalyptus globulus TaxID=34317 RepID=A0ABD3J4T6_EUCGL